MSKAAKITLEHSCANLTGGQWLRGNLHAHTTLSDGQRPPQEVISDYAGRGYGFLMLSDHDVFASAESLAQWNAGGMVLIPGNEITAHGSHILHVNASRAVPPHMPRQRVLHEIARDAGSFAVIAHPNWLANFDHTTIAQLREWTDYAGLEIYNGVIGCLEGSPYATNKWDMLLAEGRRVWGFAHDDSHRASHVELGWNQVYVREKSAPAILEALRAGRFYPSTGVTIESIQVEGPRIRIETADAERIVALCDTARRFHQVDDRTIEVEVPATAKYVRFECWGRGERMAWTQPFWITNAKEA